MIKSYSINFTFTMNFIESFKLLRCNSSSFDSFFWFLYILNGCFNIFANIKGGPLLFPSIWSKNTDRLQSVNDFFLFVFPKENLYESFLCWAYLLRSLSHSLVIIVSYNVWEIKHWLHVIIQMNLKLSISHEKDKGGSLAWFGWDFYQHYTFVRKPCFWWLKS